MRPREKLFWFLTIGSLTVQVGIYRMDQLQRWHWVHFLEILPALLFAAIVGVELRTGFFTRRK